jgi:CheY-like chemotaxis protein
LHTVISKKAGLKYNLKPKLPRIEADTTQIRQVIMNLITNASDAVGEKSGTISITTAMVNADRAYLREMYLDDNLPDGIYVIVEVTDTGCGMDAETLARIFDPFFTTKFTGRGLGLAAVMGIVRGHKGAIRVFSQVGRGTTFKVLLPAVQEAPVESVTPSFSQPEWRGQGTILVIDDEDVVRAVARKTLERAGFRVLMAEDGRKGVEVFSAAYHEVSVVLLDMMMPHLNGEETFQHLRRICPDVQVILCSGYDEIDATSKFLGKSLAGFIQKPYQPLQLLEKMREVLEGRPVLS